MLPLAYVQVGLLVIAGVVECILWLIFGHWVLRPWAEEQFGGHRPWWKRAALFPVNFIRGKLRQLENRIKSEMSHRFVQAAPPVARYLHRQARLVEQLSGVIVASNEATYKAFSKLRHTVVPGLITEALAPVKATISRHTTRLDQLEDLNRRTAVVIGNGLRGLPWGVAGTYVGNYTQWWNAFDHIWTQTFGTIMPRVNTLWSERVPNLRNRIQALEHTVEAIQTQGLPAIRQRIGRIEDFLGDLATNPTTWMLTLLGAAMLPALAPTAMRTALRNVTCRNTQDVAGRLCRTDPTFLADLLAGTLLFAIALDPRVIARAGQEVTEGMAALWRETALR